VIGLRNVVKSLFDKFDYLNGLETGTIRSYDEKHESTRHISEVLQSNGRLKSIDNNENSIKISQDICNNAENVEWILSDSIEYLSKDEDKYHFVFLDSVNDRDHIFEEFKLVFDRVHDGGVIIVDDSGVNMPSYNPAEKGLKVFDFLINLKKHLNADESEQIEIGLIQADHCTQLYIPVTALVKRLINNRL
jgi:predicted O-methyltransferase YrrM